MTIRGTILCGDIGGTATRLALYDPEAPGGSPQLSSVRVYPSASLSGPLEPIRRWERETGHRPDRVCLGIAGPILQNACRLTNLPWAVDGDALSADLGRPVRLINDFHAAARGISLLGPRDVRTLRPGTPAPGAPIAVIGPGTGLGEAYVVGDLVLPGEGGHAGFAPGTDRERRLSARLSAQADPGAHVCWEDVLSGPGLVRLHRFLQEERGAAGTAAGPAGIDLDGPDAPARVAAADPEAVAWFWELLAVEAGDMALRLLCRGGVYLCGGIPPRLADRLTGPLLARFLHRFADKGALSHALDGVPVYLVLHPDPGLLGAAAELLVAP